MKRTIEARQKSAFKKPVAIVRENLCVNDYHNGKLTTNLHPIDSPKNFNFF